jgi:hypothetical protein
MAIRCFAALLALATTQTFVTPRGEAQNVRFELREEGIVQIDYDLISTDPRAVFFVRLEISEDAGTTFEGRPLSVTGDVGNGVTAGTGKRIVWNSGKDVERVIIDRIRFRIVATGGPLQADSAQAAAAPAATPPPPAARPPQPAAKGGGSALKWILPVAAGGGVAGLLATRSGGDSGSSGPAPPPQPTADSATITALLPPDGSTLAATRPPAALTARATVSYTLVSRDSAYICVAPAVTNGVCTLQPAARGTGLVLVPFGVLETTPVLPTTTTTLRIIFGTVATGGGEFLELRFPATFNWTRP